MLLGTHTAPQSCGVRFSLLVLLGAILSQSAVSAETAGQIRDRPDIVFILTDDMRWDAMGCAGNRIIRTPHLDRLASEGFLFRNAFCTTSICATSRASILTGQYASRHGISNFSASLSPEAFAGTFPALLRKHGYRTAFIGKWLMYEESIRLPLIIRPAGPVGNDEPKVIDEMALTIDIAPTILQLAGMPAPEDMQGMSLLPLTAESPESSDRPAWREDWFYEHHYGHKGRIPRTEGVRGTRWKYTRYLDSDPLYEELFDLVRDPHEQDNLAKDRAHADRLQQMRRRWKTLAAEAK